MYVAYNELGDLVADGYDLDELYDNIESSGYCADDLLIGHVTP